MIGSAGAGAGLHKVYFNMPTPTETVVPFSLPLSPASGILDDPAEQRRFTRYAVDASGERIADSALRISGMHCAACAALIEQALTKVDGVLDAQVSAAGERARVRWSPQRTCLADVVAAIGAAGYSATPDLALDAREARQLEHRAAIWQLFVAAFCAMQGMIGLAEL